MTSKPNEQQVKPRSWQRDYGVLAVLWLAAALGDRLWLHLDQAPPAWDQGDHLSRAMNYWRVLQQPDLWSKHWWTELWKLSPTYRAPFVYLATVPFLAWFGAGYDQATLVNLVFTGVLLLATYHLGSCLFSAQVGLWAAGLCLLSHTLAVTRIDYLLDYGLTASLTVAFTFLTYWRYYPRQGWRWTIASGIALGIVFLNRPTGLLFLAVPLGWLGIEAIIKRQWGRLGQLIILGLIATGLGWPWFSTNWLTVLSSIAQANANGFVYEGEPQANTLAGWLHYARELPTTLSFPIVTVGLGCGLIALGRWLCQGQAGNSDARISTPSAPGAWAWLVSFAGGIYVLCSLAANKDPRFIQPYLPAMALVFARLLTLGIGRWWSVMRWGTAIVATVLLLTNLFPLVKGGSSQHHPYQGASYPHEQVIATIIQQQPYQRSTIGLVANTAQINPMNVDFYGAVANFQVYGRQLAFSEKTALPDSRALDWYLTKTGDQGAYNAIEAGQQALKQLVESSPDLALHRTWQLPDGSELRLYHRRNPSITVTVSDRAPGSTVALLDITLPSVVAPGNPAPVTYTWSGSWADLRDGLVLMDWVPSQIVVSNRPIPWLQDHGIGLGHLYAGATPPLDTTPMQVVERLALQPPANLPTGQYRLQVTYLNRKTGKSYPLAIPDAIITVADQAAPQPVPELDVVTQVRSLAALLPQGQLEPVFNDIGRINQYDPIQDYVPQLELMLKHRLQADPDRLDLLYTLGLIYVLQQRPQPAIATFTRLTQLDGQNPWAWAYLGLARLYSFQPWRATAALNQAETLKPGIPEVETLQIVAAAMRLDIPTVRQIWQREQAKT